MGTSEGLADRAWLRAVLWGMVLAVGLCICQPDAAFASNTEGTVDSSASPVATAPSSAATTVALSTATQATATTTGQSQSASSSIQTAKSSSAAATTASGTTTSTTIATTTVTTVKAASSSATPSADSAQTIADGTYAIETGVSNSQVLDVAGGSKRNGANVQGYTSNMTKAQQWQIKYDAEKGYYTITNVISNKVLDVSCGAARNGANVQVYAANGTDAQYWSIVKKGDGYEIVSALKSSLVLDVAGANPRDNANVQIYTRNNTPAQLFRFLLCNPQVAAGDTIANGCYAIVSTISNSQVVEVAGGAYTAGANVSQYSTNGTMAQKFYFQINSAGFYTIANVNSGKVLDVAGGNLVPGTNVQQYWSNGTVAQQWSLRKNADGTYTLICRANGLALDIAGASAKDGANVQVYTPNGTPAQNFTLKTMELLADGVYSITSVIKPGQAVLDVPAASKKTGTGVQLWTYNGSMAQKYMISTTSDGLRQIQAVCSGYYLSAAANDRVQQLAASNTDASKWTIEWCGSSFKLTNKATGLVLDVSGSNSADGTPVNQYASNDTRAQRFLMMSIQFIDNGCYNIISAIGQKVLDVAGGSFDNGANVQIYESNGSNAQKFLIENEYGAFYRLINVISGRAIDVDGASKVSGANVQMYGNNGSEAQLWQVVIAPGGYYYFINKAAGNAMSVDGSADRNGANVSVTTQAQTTNQKWYTAETSLSLTDNGSWMRVVNSASGASALVVFNNTKGYQISAAANKAVADALANFWSAGHNVGFVLIDLNTGIGVSWNADSYNHGASCTKAAYLTYICQNLLDTGAISFSDVAYLMEETAVNSNNDTYATLRQMFGPDGFNSWLASSGIAGFGDDYYPDLSAKRLAQMWTKIMSYQASGAAYTGWWHSIFSHPNVSPIHETLGGSATTYSKAGWVSDAYNDSGIIIKDGRTYMMSIVSESCVWNDGWMMNQLVAALDYMHSQMPLQ